jgi:hypothetical protein
MKKFGIVLLLLLSLPATNLLKAQDYTVSVPKPEKDFQTWTDIGLRCKLTKKFKIDAEFGHRRRENARLLKENYVDVSLSYRVWKQLNLAAGYRYSYEYDDDYENRIYADVSYGIDFSRFNLETRARFQRNYQSTNIEDGYWRQKTALSYNIKGLPLNPYLSAETFYHFIYTGNQFDRVRYEAGVAYSLPRKTQLSLFFLNQREFNVVKPKYAYVLGLSLRLQVNEWGFSNEKE